MAEIIKTNIKTKQMKKGKTGTTGGMKSGNAKPVVKKGVNTKSTNKPARVKGK